MNHVISVDKGCHMRHVKVVNLRPPLVLSIIFWHEDTSRSFWFFRRAESEKKKILQQESSQLLASLGYTNHATLHPPTRAPRAWTHAWLMSPPGRQDWPVKSQCSAGLLVIDWCLFCFSTFRGGVPFIFECNLIIIYTFIMILIICFHTIYIHSIWTQMRKSRYRKWMEYQIFLALM